VAVYKLVLKPSAAKNVDQIDRRADRNRIVKRIQALAENPRPPGCEKLEGSDHTYRVRQGDYRILYDIDDEAGTIVIIKVRHRKDVYRRGRA